MVLAPSALVPTASPAQAQQHHHEVFKPDALKWIDPPTFPGAKLAIMHGDPGKEGLFVYRVKFPANYKVPSHFHKASESVTVLSGVFFIGAGEKFDQGAATEVPVGGFVFIPPTHPHFAWAGGQEAVIQVHGVGPTDITFVNPADDPRKK
jgi:uncharacterized RmlC-like cupin family protein